MVRIGRRWTRRCFLRAAGIGAAGAGLLPFVPRSIADAAEGPKRLVLVTHGNGVDLTRWRPTGGETDFALSYILEPFEPYRDWLLVLDGLDNEAIAPSDRRGVGHDGMSTLWTGLELPAGEFGDKHVGWPVGPSIDHVVAERIGAETRYPAYYFGTSGSGVTAEGPIRTAHHRGSNEPIQTQNYPARAFDDLFGGVVGDDPAAARLRARRQSVLDAVTGELGRLRGELPAGDRDCLDAHLDGVRRIEERLAAAASLCVAPERPYDFTYAEQDDSESLPHLSDLQLEIMAHALACDLTRVACLQWGGEGSTGTGSFLDDLGYERFGGIHTQSHEMNYTTTEGMGLSDADVSRARQNMANLNRWRAQTLVSGLLDRLAPEVRDNTLLVWGSAMCEGGCHSNRNIPVVVIQGSGFDYFSTGRYLRWGEFDPLTAYNGFNRYSGGTPMNKMLVSIGQAMGLSDIGTFGEPDIESGPLVEALR